MIRETAHEFCVIAEYKDGDSFCLAKFMYEEDARAWCDSREQKEWVKYKVYKRYGGYEEARWEEV